MIVLPTRRHVLQVTRDLCPVLRARAEDAGIDPRRATLAFFDASPWARAWVEDGKCLGMGGIVAPMMASEGQVWLSLSEHARKQPMKMARLARAGLAEALRSFRRLEAVVDAASERDIRFARWMGFKLGEPEDVGGVKLRRAVIDTTPPPPFVIFGLPRSRTTWLSQFLTDGPWVCVHDALLSLDGMDDLVNLLRLPYTGLSETALAFAAPAIRRHFPRCRFVVVNRPLEEVKDSLGRIGWAYPDGFLEREQERLEAISAMPGAMTVEFDALNREEVCRDVYRHCTGREPPPQRWGFYSHRVIQPDTDECMRRSIERTPQMARVMVEARTSCPEVTIQEEEWGSVLRDGRDLFAEHYAEVGPFPGMPFNPDYAALGRIADSGVMMITTVRANGYLVGYLAFVLEPSLVSKGVVFGNQNTVYLRKEFRGPIGLRLYRTALARLKQRGVHRVILRAGVVGSGPKQEHLFRRMGASDFGQLFSLWIGE